MGRGCRTPDVDRGKVPCGIIRRAELLAPVVVGGIACTYLLQVRLQRQPTRLVGQLQIDKLVMCHNQNSCSWVQYCWAKVQPNYNWNNVYFIGCLLLFCFERYFLADGAQEIGRNTKLKLLVIDLLISLGKDQRPVPLIVRFICYFTLRSYIKSQEKALTRPKMCLPK